jgi:hypothetical protein
LIRFARTHGADDPANLVRQGRVGLIDRITLVLAGCRQLLRPGAISVITARPWRRDRYLVHLPGHMLAAGIVAGMQPIGRHVALLGGYRDGRFIPGTRSFS